jgi:hypothetical protein
MAPMSMSPEFPALAARISTSPNFSEIYVEILFPFDAFTPPKTTSQLHKSITMCMKATCSSCGKTTWYGCGEHIGSVLDNVAADQWCTCEPKVEKNGKTYPPKAAK